MLRKNTLYWRDESLGQSYLRGAVLRAELFER